MTTTTRRPGYLTLAERERVMRELDRILVAAQVVDDHLGIAASRTHVSRTGWSLEQLDALCDAARALQRATMESPVVDA